MREHLREVFARRDDPYAGVDLANASRFGGALWLVGAVLTALILPLVPPTDAIGDAGWVVAGALMVGGIAAGWRMRSAGPTINPSELLFYNYTAIAAIGTLVWLSGGLNSPYGQLLLLGALYTCGSHPARRLVPYLAFFVVVALLPLAYSDHVARRDATEAVVELVVWMALSLAVLFLMHNVRSQRLGLRREGEQARHQARVDPLTGLLNRRAFDEDLSRAIESSRASGQPLSVLVGDLDGFKDFNDSFGHLEGDKVLQEVAAALRAAVRGPDVAYRWGGDEFAVVLPQADRLGAELVAERVEAAIALCSGPDGEALGISTGVAEYEHGQTAGAADLLVVADTALMRAKGSGAFEVPQAQG